ncbi:protein kinase domain protein, partial [Ichthyophthirius multifiliis]
ILLQKIKIWIIKMSISKDNGLSNQVKDVQRIIMISILKKFQVVEPMEVFLKQKKKTLKLQEQQNRFLKAKLKILNDLKQKLKLQDHQIILIQLNYMKLMKMKGMFIQLWKYVKVVNYLIELSKKEDLQKQRQDQYYLNNTSFKLLPFQRNSSQRFKTRKLLYLTKHDDSPIKVIDFGLSKNFDQNVSMQTKAGTPYYISPEVLDGKYDQSCDIWSAGVILYILLSGVPPFFGDDDSEILQAVKKGVFTYEIPEFEGVSKSAKDLISQMITKPEKRYKPEQVLNHPWMKEELKNKNKQLPLNFNALKNFTQHHKLKKVALSFIASQLSENEISELGKLFRQLDKNGDGVLTIDEIRDGLTNSSDKNLEEVRKVISSIDTDGSGKIDYTEFLAATMEKSLYMKEDKLHQAFKMLDQDGNGKITKQELKAVLGRDQSFAKQNDNYWDDMIKEVDKNGDGEIDYNEFIDMMNIITYKK